MKLKYKITLLFLVLYSVALISISHLITENTRTSILESEIVRNLNIEETVNINLSYNLIYSINEDMLEDSFDKFAKYFIDSFGNNTLMLSISDYRDRDIASNAHLSIPLTTKELVSLRKNSRSYILKHVDDSFYMITYRHFEYSKKRYFLKTIKDISFVDNMLSKNRSTFLNVSLIVSVFIIILALFFSHVLTKPIWNLISASEKISKGNYTNKLQLKKRNSDEIYELSKRFNEMADIIGEKISSLEMENQRKEQFIHNLSHEIRTPLTSIIGFSDLLNKMPYEKETFHKSLNYINSEGKRLLDISNLLLRIARIKKDEIAMDSVAAFPLLENVLDVSNTKYPKREIVLDPSSIDFIFYMNSNLIKLSLHNLIENSVNASSSDSPISIGTTMLDDTPCFFVRDFGVGMDTEDIQYIFDPFYRIDHARSRETGGTGLGLSLCSEIAKIHGGHIHVESSKGVGSTFYIVIKKE